MHHIIPILAGGDDQYWNYVCLCHDCHRHMGLHGNYFRFDVELYTWKCSAENARLGFILDERDKHFTEKFHELLERLKIICPSTNPLDVKIFKLLPNNQADAITISSIMGKMRKKKTEKLRESIYKVLMKMFKEKLVMRVRDGMDIKWWKA